MKKTKLKYEKPAMQVFELKHQCHILAGSAQNAQGENFGWDEDE